MIVGKYWQYLCYFNITHIRNTGLQLMSFHYTASHSYISLIIDFLGLTLLDNQKLKNVLSGMDRRIPRCMFLSKVPVSTLPHSVRNNTSCIKLPTSPSHLICGSLLVATTPFWNSRKEIASCRSWDLSNKLAGYTQGPSQGL